LLTGFFAGLAAASHASPSVGVISVLPAASLVGTCKVKGVLAAAAAAAAEAEAVRAGAAGENRPLWIRHACVIDLARSPCGPT
jgi:hypothetical protein